MTGTLAKTKYVNKKKRIYIYIYVYIRICDDFAILSLTLLPKLSLKTKLLLKLFYVESYETYVGFTVTEFKTRWRNRQMSFKLKSKINDTELSKLLWQLKDEKKDFAISWKILAKAKSYDNLTKRCYLCNTEKSLHFAWQQALNQRNELVLQIHVDICACVCITLLKSTSDLE